MTTVTHAARTNPSLRSQSILTISWICAPVILIAVLYTGGAGMVLWSPIIASASILVLPTTRVKMRAVDWTVLLIVALEMPSVLFSQYRANSLQTAGLIALSATVYWIVRLTVRTPEQAALFSGLLGFGGAWLAVSCLHRFVESAKFLRDAGLYDLIAFRSQLMTVPAPWVLGERLTVLLLALPFACAPPIFFWRTGRRWWATATLGVPLSIVPTLSLALSRGVFWSTVLFACVAAVLMVAYRVVTLRFGAVLCLSALVVLAVTIACGNVLYPGTSRAYFERQPSQIRSAEGRISIWRRSLELLRADPLLGVGSSNAALALTSNIDREKTTGFASRTFSLPVQLLVEKGSIGFLLYSAFLFLVGREFHLGMRSPPQNLSGQPNDNVVARAPREVGTDSGRKEMACCFAAGALAVLARELTYSSLLEHTVTLALFLSLAALLCSSETSLTKMRMKPVVLVMSSLVFVLQFVLGDYDKANSDMRSFYTEMLSADFVSARESIDEAINLWPGNARFYGWRGYCSSQRLPAQCPRALQAAGVDLNVIDRAAAKDAIEDYRQALKLNSRDAVAYHNLAWLEHLLADDEGAGRDWRKAIEIDPDNTVFHLSYGMFLDETGNSQQSAQQYEIAVESSPAILDSPFFTRYRSRSPRAAESVVANCKAKIEGRLRDGSDPILEAKLGKLYEYSGDLTRSSQLLRDASRALPNLPLVWLNLGEISELQGDTAVAADCYNKAKVIESSLAEAYLRLGLIELHKGDRNAADQNLRMSIKRWQRVNPITAAHNNRLYVGPPQMIDDLLPTTLVWYVTPCQASAAWSALAEMFPERQEYAQRSRVCEELPSPHLGGNSSE